MNSVEEEYRVSRILADCPNIVNVYSFQRQKQIKIEGRLEIKDFLILEYASNSDLFEFLTKCVQRQNKQGLV